MPSGVLSNVANNIRNVTKKNMTSIIETICTSGVRRLLRWIMADLNPFLVSYKVDQLFGTAVHLEYAAVDNAREPVVQRQRRNRYDQPSGRCNKGFSNTTAEGLRGCYTLQR